MSLLGHSHTGKKAGCNSLRTALRDRARLWRRGTTSKSTGSKVLHKKKGTKTPRNLDNEGEGEKRKRKFFMLISQKKGKTLTG